GLGVAGFISLFLTMAVGEALAPPYTQRLLIGATPAKTARGTVLSGLFSIPFFLMTGVIGLTAFALGTGGSPDEAMPAMILTVLPLGLRGLVMAAMVSIMLSAADGFLNGAAIGLVCDTLLPLFPEIKEKNQLRWLRGVNLVTGLAALVMALLMPSIFDILVLAYSFWGPLILVPLAAALLGVRADRRCFRNAVLAGLGLMLWWNYLMGKPLEIDGGVVGLAGNLMAFAGSYRAYKKR
ncbi:MAG: hypothetical protein FWE80_06140, partial [Oscillospiraceae bacterium]|nr:hypothetical protein [Oscillospiraceae bacterium]